MNDSALVGSRRSDDHQCAASCAPGRWPGRARPGPGEHRTRPAGCGRQSAADHVVADGAPGGRPHACLRPARLRSGCWRGDEVLRQLVPARMRPCRMTSRLPRRSVRCELSRPALPCPTVSANDRRAQRHRSPHSFDLGFVSGHGRRGSCVVAVSWLPSPRRRLEGKGETVSDGGSCCCSPSGFRGSHSWPPPALSRA